MEKETYRDDLYKLYKGIREKLYALRWKRRVEAGLKSFFN